MKDGWWPSVNGGAEHCPGAWFTPQTILQLNLHCFCAVLGTHTVNCHWLMGSVSILFAGQAIKQRGINLHCPRILLPSRLLLSLGCTYLYAEVPIKKTLWKRFMNITGSWILQVPQSSSGVTDKARDTRAQVSTSYPSRPKNIRDTNCLYFSYVYNLRQ